MIITLLTDFGVADHFVGAMKGVILTRAPAARIVDISHEVPRHDIENAAFLLLCCYSDFPAGTVHLAVVDPGVGTARRPIVARAGSHSFVGPDNGIFSWALEAAGEFEVRQIGPGVEAAREASSTFHGRDLFAPMAASLASGDPFEKLGAPITDPVRLAPLRNRNDPGGTITGRLLHIDRFGNCLTSFARDDFPGGRWQEFRLRLGNSVIEESRPHYGAGIGAGPFLILGSAGFLEISINRGAAAELLRASRGDVVVAEPR